MEGGEEEEKVALVARTETVADDEDDDTKDHNGSGVEIKYLPLKLFFVHHVIIDQDHQDLYLICMCAAFRLQLARSRGAGHRDTWTTRHLAHDASTYIHSRKQEYQEFRLDLEFEPEHHRFHCDRPWRVPIENLPGQSADPVVEPYSEITLHIEQLDLELNGGPRIREKVFTKPIQECPAHMDLLPFPF